MSEHLAGVRVRFCPSPTGSPHVGFARTALYNWASPASTAAPSCSASRTPTRRATPRSPTRGWSARWGGSASTGTRAPARAARTGRTASPSAATSTATCWQAADSEFTYDCYCTTEEVDARRKASGSKVQGYDGFCRDLTAEQLAAFEAEGRRPVVRFRMPDGTVAGRPGPRRDQLRDPHVPDFALCRANGDPLYTLVNPVDDALMGITHVLRGEDLLSSTPRQIPLHRALVELGVSTAVPEFGHLPLVTGEGNKKLSKRDPRRTCSCTATRIPARGLPQLPGPAGLGDRGRPGRVHAGRDGRGVRDPGCRLQPGPLRRQEGRGDQRRPHADAAVEEIADRVRPFLKAAGVLGDPVYDADAELLEFAMPLVAERINSSPRPWPCSGSSSSTRRRSSRSKQLDEAGREVVRRRTTRWPGWPRGRPRRSRQPCARRWSRSASSSRGWPTGRCGSR